MKKIIEEQKKNDERKKGKSVQINRNGINGKRDSSINSVKIWKKFMKKIKIF